MILVDKFSSRVGRDSAFKLLDSAVSALTYVMTALVMVANESIDLTKICSLFISNSIELFTKFVNR